MARIYIDTLSGEPIEPEAVRALTLPSDNWYTAEEIERAEDLPKWGTAPAHLFGLYDDGAGPRWLPITPNND